MWFGTQRTINVFNPVKPEERFLRMIDILSRCTGLAVDWMGRNVYYIDSYKLVINVCWINATDAEECLSVVERLTEKPTSLVLDPFAG